MKKIFSEFEDLIWTKKYLDYLQLREKGLKKKSQLELKEFFEIFHLQNNAQRRNFIDLVCTLAYKTKKYSTYLPENMFVHIFRPALNCWIAEEPTNPIPFKWSDDFNNNKRAIELDPQGQIGLEKFAKLLIGKISMNQHELSSTHHYDGIVDEDIALIIFFEKFLKNIVDCEMQNTLSETLAELKKSAFQYQTMNK